MILMINKWHRTEAGETASSVKVEKPTEIEAYKEAKKQEYQLAANYMADNTVLDWTLCVFNPKTVRVVEPMQYFTPAPAVEEMPVEE